MITDKPSLLARYETLRRKEYERLTALLDTLGQVDGLPADQMDQARDALFHADHPYLIVLIGAFNAGKSSIINGLLGQPVLDVGATPTTAKITILRYGPSMQRSQAGEVETLFYPLPLLERVSLVDTPGLESVFKEHEALTRRFLHRADIVMFVMLATQAMSAGSLEYLQSLRAYGKRIIVVVNQIDLVEPEERDTLKNFILEQGKASLGTTPDVWMVSAREALQAQQSTPRNEALWQASGFAQIEQFIDQALGDAARVRQKLETPLQIARNVMTVAIAQVRDQQNALDDYRRSAANVRGQIDSATREQEATIRATLSEIDTTFAEATRRGREAIRDVFDLSRSLGLVLTGVTELIGFGRLARRFGVQSYAASAFEMRRVDEPLAQIPAIIDRLGPRLEGRDVKDTDDLINYTNREIERLPESFKEKLIGKLEPPPTYDRTIIRSARENMLASLEQARSIETKRIDRAVRGSLVILGIYELAVLIGLIVGAITLTNAQSNNLALVLLVLAIVLGVGGILLIPLRGRLMELSYAARMISIKTELTQALENVAGQQVTFGVQMRRNAVAPFLRLVEAQVSLVDKLKTDLEAHQQGLIELEKELGHLGR